MVQISRRAASGIGRRSPAGIFSQDDISFPHANARESRVEKTVTGPASVKIFSGKAAGGPLDQPDRCFVHRQAVEGGAIQAAERLQLVQRAFFLEDMGQEAWCWWR